MSDQDKDPVVTSTLSKHLFIWSVLLVLSLVWGLWDEMYGIRPWKDYQAKFRKSYAKYLTTAKGGAADELRPDGCTAPGVEGQKGRAAPEARRRDGEGHGSARQARQVPRGPHCRFERRHDQRGRSLARQVRHYHPPDSREGCGSGR